MSKTKICAVQFKVNTDFNKNFSRIEKFFSIANKSNCNIICFPEIFLTGPLSKEKYDKKISFQAKKFFPNYQKHIEFFR